MLNVVFMGTPEFAAQSLKLVINSHNVQCVYTQPDRPAGRGRKLTASEVKQLALASGITVHQPENLKNETTILNSLNPDIIVVVAYGLLLPQVVLDIPRFGCINVHGSLLPRWRGAAPIQRAIEAGDNKSGVCIMQMEAGLDTGPVFSSHEVPLEKTTTAGELHDQLASAGAEELIEVLNAIEHGQAIAEPQSETGATYASKLSRSEARIGWHANASDIERKIRAFNPWPICTTSYKNKDLRILLSCISTLDHSSESGEVIQVDRKSITVACGEGAINLISLQKPGGRALTTAEFLNGHHVAIGDFFS
jgi:methionyl-tRNA formyltransferase